MSTTVNEKREQIDCWKVVNIAEDGEILVLDYLFEHGTMNGKPFKGATGSRFYPVSKRQYKEQTTIKAIAERLESCVREDEIPDQYGTYRKWAKAIKDAGEEQEFAFDTSYYHLWDYLREATGLDEKSAYIFECVGGGRMFDKDFQGNVNPELSELIRKYESD